MPKDFLCSKPKGRRWQDHVRGELWRRGLAKVGQRVLLVDLDPQGNATMGSGVDKRQLELSVYDVLLESASIQEAAIFSEKCGYHVLGANRELAGAEVELVDLRKAGSAPEVGI
jgi:cellulose biosynthesis protein BcsQ